MSRAFLSNGAGPASASLDTGGRTIATNHAKLLIAKKSHFWRVQRRLVCLPPQPRGLGHVNLISGFSWLPGQTKIFSFFRGPDRAAGCKGI